jgi:hypothetical protein
MRSEEGSSLRPCSTAWTVVGAVLLVHAALVLAGAHDLPLWVPVLECLVASLVGIRQLRRFTELTGQSASAPQAPQSSSPPAGFPARMAAPRDDASGSSVGR